GALSVSKFVNSKIIRHYHHDHLYHQWLDNPRWALAAFRSLCHPTFLAKEANLLMFTKFRFTEPSGGTTVSRLVIPTADQSDSGMYTCSLSKHSSVVVHVHVLN
ncbi:hypothetical protein L9F63_009387, partial [Diploptera punctata]